ncbi:hypothetical protein [Kingella potus]|uniref:hypothetical protein n=1 Tax=Kingella potus TaxID=265175 RepID=UPI001FD3CAF3|nr:hypothetical protein [Kingella potus]UOP00801.1 hypothetical protein LVJ84_13790 [Kingella potus]
MEKRNRPSENGNMLFRRPHVAYRAKLQAAANACAARAAHPTLPPAANPLPPLRPRGAGQGRG